MARSLLALLALSAVGTAGCAGSASRGSSSTDLTYLTLAPPQAALDSVAAWAARTDGLSGERAPDTVVVRDLRPGEDNRATVTAEARADGATAVTVRSRYGAGRPAAFRDLGLDLLADRAPSGAFAVARPETPPCFSEADWLASGGGPAIRPVLGGRPVAAVAGTPPELVGGLAGLQRRVEYPTSLRRAGVSGTVLTQFVVDEAGAVECAEVLSSPDPQLSRAALAAVRGSVFQPGAQDRPVRVRLTLPIRFAVR